VASDDTDAVYLSSQVARHIFEHCIVGFLSRRTVMLVTHNLHFLDQVSGHSTAMICRNAPIGCHLLM
jgi:hypothetical protein